MKNCLILSALVLLTLATNVSVAQQGYSHFRRESKPAVVVTVRNEAPELGTFQTPVWIGFHDGTFDLYDRNAAANTLPAQGSVGIERLAEDGNTGPISSDFSNLFADGVQSTVTSNTPGRPPLAPQERTSRLFRVDPSIHRYFSYASMVIPSNDAFIANGSPTAHEIFNDQKRFVARRFRVLGNEVLDAGTEINDELPANTAFFGQQTPNTGVDENGVIVQHPGFMPVGNGGILDSAMFRNANFLQQDYRAMRFQFKFIDLAFRHSFFTFLTAGQEVDPPTVSGFPFGKGIVRSQPGGNRLSYFVFVRGLTGNPTAAHFHVGLRGQNGPVVVDLLDGGTIINFGSLHLLFGSVDVDDVVGPFATTEKPFDALLGELVTSGIYINVHTQENPAGEVRGQMVFIH